jgi:hypothetical protein
MTTVELKLNLPDQLARDAQQAGLLTADAIAAMLREQLKTQHIDDLFAAMDRMAAVDTPAVMSPEEIAEEIRVMRAERRAKNAG